MPEKVSVIIPCRNESQTIRLVLSALSNQSYAHSAIEIIIADGLSEDTTRQEIAAFSTENPGIPIRVVDNPKRTIPAAINKGIQAATGDIFIRMDAHSLPQPDYVARCVEALHEGKADNVGGVWDIQPQVDTCIARAIAVAASHPLAVGGAHYRFSDKAQYVDTVPYGAFKRELVERIGGFDESLLSNEDYEFNARIRLSGGKIWMDPAIRCTYFARASLHQLAKQYWRYGFWKAQMLKRYPDTLRARQAIPPLFVLSLIVLGIITPFFPPAGWLLLGLMSFYLLALLVIGTQLAFKNKDARLFFGVPLAIACMHFPWGMALLVGLLTKTEQKRSGNTL